MNAKSRATVPVDAELFDEVYRLLVTVANGEYDDLDDVELDASDLVPRIAQLYAYHLVTSKED